MDATFGDCWGCKSPSKGIKCVSCNVAEYCSIDCRMRYRHIHKAQCPCCSALSSCSWCKDKSTNLKKCSRCFSALYCNSDCQKQHWSDHKLQCKEFIDSAKQMTRLLKYVVFLELPWYLGITLAEDYLNISKNEGESYNVPLKLLFAAVGDLKDVVKTVVDVPRKYSKNIEFVLNDYSPHIMARNILFLYCALVEKNTSHLIQIWYSFKLTAKCLEFLTSVLTSLITLSRNKMLTDFSLLEINDNHLNICKEVWKGWLRLANNKMAMKKISAFREKLLKSSDSLTGLQNYYSTIPEVHVESLKVFFDSGILASDDNHRRDAKYGNPTMTCFNSMIQEYKEKFPDIHTIRHNLTGMQEFITKEEEMIYSVREDAFVFTCWDYLDVKKHTTVKLDISQMYIT